MDENTTICQLNPPRPRFDMRRYREHARNIPYCHSIVTFDAVASTNDYLKSAAQHFPSDLIIVADHQSAGRGRSGRIWQSPPGVSLLCSLLVRPSIKPEHTHWLTMLTGIAALAAIQAVCQLPLYLKWPNDLIAVRDGRWYKVGGILVETELDEATIQHAVIGIGINVNLRDSNLSALNQTITNGLHATSLLALTAKKISREQLLAEFIGRFHTALTTAESGISPHEEWQRFLAGIGEQVQVGDVTGTLTGIDQFGRLLINDGTAVHAIPSGDLSLRQRP